MKNGLIHIYTGDGKGKTTAAVGLAVRALGHDQKVCFVYFHKNPEKYGYTEIESLRKLGAETIGFVKEHPFCEKNISIEELSKKTAEALNSLTEKLKDAKYDLLILDEVNISVREGFLPEKKVLEFMDNKPDELELVLTGRGATANMIEKADYVSNIDKIKHPYDKKTSAREGIEY